MPRPTRQKWTPGSPESQSGAARQAATRERNPDYGLGASARATQREERQASDDLAAQAPFASRERARTLPKPKSWGEHLAFWRERGAEVLCGVLASPDGLPALYVLVRHADGRTPAWWLCGTGRAVTAAELEAYGGREAAEQWPLSEDWPAV